MTRAGDTVGTATRKGVRAVRRGAIRARQAGAEATVRAAHAAEQKLTEHGVTPHQLADALTEGAEVARREVARTTRRTRRKLARKAKRMRREMARTAARARRQAAVVAVSAPVDGTLRAAKQVERQAKRSLKGAGKAARRPAGKADRRNRRRRWPWLLLMAAAAGVAYVLRSRPTEVGGTSLGSPGVDQPTGDGRENLDAQRNGQPSADRPTSERPRQ